MSVICRKVLLKLTFRTLTFSKTHPCKYFVYMNRGNSSQKWRVNYANSNILWHFVTTIIWHTSVFFCKCKNLYFTLPLLLCFTFNLRAISNYKHPGAIYRRAFWDSSVRGLYLRGLFLEFYRMLVWRILAATTKALNDRPPQFFTE